MKREDADQLKLAVMSCNIDPVAKADVVVFIEEQVEDVDKIPFEQFWGSYPKRVGAKPCKDKWKRMTAKKQKMALYYLRPYLMRVGDYINEPINYLNKELYMDFYYEAMARQGSTKKDLYGEK